MKKIKTLDNSTINKIAAGEVIERPGSVVKELIENSIDAGAKNIIIEIKQGGKTYIRVTDDGSGIYKEDIKNAFLRHSTSKITSVEDLQNTLSLGFRGEALASISSVSKVEVLSKVSEESFGQKYVFIGGTLEKSESIGTSNGTTMIVKDLFYNIPVRKKFLKSDRSEGMYITSLISNLALSSPHISFQYIKDEETIFKTSGDSILKNTLHNLYGSEIIESTLDLKFADNKFSCYGIISKSTYSRGNRSEQLIFINNRIVKNMGISKKIESLYKDIIPNNKFPIFVLYIKINPKYIDINIHPSKTEVKFSEEDYILNVIEKHISFLLKKEESSLRSENILSPSKEIVYSLDSKKISSNIASVREPQLNLFDSRKSNYDYNQNNSEHSLLGLENITFKGVVFKNYLLLENHILDEFIVIDQHAAHERVLYEEYKNSILKDENIIQNIFSSKPLSFSNSDFELINKNKPFFKKLGFEFEDFGFNSIILRGVPSLIKNINPQELFLDILDNFKIDINSPYEIRLENIMKLACTKAIKTGDTMDISELDSLLIQLKKTDFPNTCPHGRPTMKSFSKKDFDKLFKRL